MSSEISHNECPFCTDPDPVLRNELAFARFDRFAVNPGHVLIIPFRHVSSFFDLTGPERTAVVDLVPSARALIENRYKPDGYNIGINIGQAAGQSIWHVHLHVIPRYKGDVPNPRGGVRGVVPMKQDY